MIFIIAAPLLAIAEDRRPPVIDMHLHAIPVDFQGAPPQTICSPFLAFPAWDPATPYPELMAGIGRHPACGNPIVSPVSNQAVMQETLAILEELNVYGVASGPPPLVERWVQAAPDRVFPGLMFRLGESAPSPETVMQMHRDGRLVVFGEVVIQYQGIEPDDPRFEPYLAMAEAADLPVGIHIGTGPPGAPYLGHENYRARMHSPLSLEEPLAKHPGLRIYVMHAGWPMLDDMLALLYAHPQVYVGLGVISHVLPRAEFHRYLRRLVEAGFGERVMFGSDQMIWPETIRVAIESIESATFLSKSQKRAILYDNAARFLRLPDSLVAAHHGRPEANRD